MRNFAFFDITVRNDTARWPCSVSVLASGVVSFRKIRNFETINKNMQLNYYMLKIIS